MLDASSLPPPADGSPDLLIIAGEHSGDEHAAKIVAELKESDPEYQVACLGGVELRAAGAQLLYDLTAVSIVGFVEVVKHYSFFKDLFDRTLEWIERYRPKQICFVDYPGFNLRLANQLFERGLSRKGGGDILLSYYIGPQIWAWKAKRRFKMAKVLDRLGVIFPFEIDCYKDTDLPVEFVGHPFARDDFKCPFVFEKTAPVLLLPGSRTIPVSRIFPTLLDGFSKALQEEPGLTARVVYPSQQIHELLVSVLDGFPRLQERVEFVPNGASEMPASSVLMSSGTMSLAVALSGIPGAIAYRLHPLSYLIGKAVVKIPYIGIANLLLERPLHPEFIQARASGANLAEALLNSRRDSEIKSTHLAVDELRDLLDPVAGSHVGAWLKDF